MIKSLFALVLMWGISPAISSGGISQTQIIASSINYSVNAIASDRYANAKHDLSILMSNIEIAEEMD